MTGLIIVATVSWLASLYLACSVAASRVREVRDDAAERERELADEVKSLRTQLASAEADAAQAEENAALIENLHDHSNDVLRIVAAERDDLEQRADRTFALPTLHGLRDDLLDRIDAMEDGERIDYMAEIRQPILTAMGGEVVPIKRKKGVAK